MIPGIFISSPSRLQFSPLISLCVCMAPQRTHSKISGAPDYDSPEFWDARFATGSDVGEWLNSGDVLIDAVLSDLNQRPHLHAPSEAPRVLHLGPGVSQLGRKLRDACLEKQWAGNGILVSLRYCAIGLVIRVCALLTIVSLECRLLHRSCTSWPAC